MIWFGNRALYLDVIPLPKKTVHKRKTRRKDQVNYRKNERILLKGPIPKLIIIWRRSIEFKNVRKGLNKYKVQNPVNILVANL